MCMVIFDRHNRALGIKALFHLKELSLTTTVFDSKMLRYVVVFTLIVGCGEHFTGCFHYLPVLTPSLALSKPIEITDEAKAEIIEMAKQLEELMAKKDELVASRDVEISGLGLLDGVIQLLRRLLCR